MHDKCIFITGNPRVADSTLDKINKVYNLALDRVKLESRVYYGALSLNGVMIWYLLFVKSHKLKGQLK